MKKFLTLLIAAGLVAGGVYYYLDGAATGPAGSAKGKKRGGGPVPVLVAQVRSQTVPVTIDTIGSMQALATVAVKSRVDGQMMESFFRDGQLVHKGDRLFTIDPRPFLAKVHEVEANLARDRAQLANARSDLSRYQRLSQSGYSSQQKFDQARAAAEVYAAAVKANSAALERAKLDLEFTTIRSPIDGRLGSVLVDPGNLVKANDSSPLVVINQTKPIYVAFSVPEQHLPEIKSRMAAEGLGVEVIVPGASSPAERGKVAFVNNAVDAATGTIQLKAELANAREQLTPGQFVRVNLVLREIPNALVVPSQSVQNGQMGSYVYIVQPNQRVVLKPVELGPPWKDNVVVSGKLASGDTVVTEGHLRLRPGARVTITPETAGAGGQGAGSKAGKKRGRKKKPAS
jgi:multidrug efflux system membrane fusion protein